MTEKKKMGAGLVLSVITVLVTVAGLVLYMMNCKTNYFVKTTVLIIQSLPAWLLLRFLKSL